MNTKPLLYIVINTLTHISLYSGGMNLTEFPAQQNFCSSDSCKNVYETTYFHVPENSTLKI
jgi:hypothetical protein